MAYQETNLLLTMDGSDSLFSFPDPIFAQFLKETQKLGQHDP